MSMQKKMRLQKILIGVLCVVISIIAFGTFLGRTQTETIYVIRKDGVDLSKSLSEQPQFVDTHTILKSELENMNGRVVTDASQLKNKKLTIPLKAGSPILLDALIDVNGGGAFSNTMDEFHTVHKIKEGVTLLPPGAAAGDKLDIALTIEEKDSQGSTLTTGVLMKGIEIHSIDETNVYVKVSQQQDLILSTSEKIGTFILQLPGQKKSLLCKDLDKEVEKRVDAFIKNEKEKAKKAGKKGKDMPKFDKAALIKQTKEKTSCVDADKDKPTKVTRDQIVQKVTEDVIETATIEDPTLPENEETTNTDEEATHKVNETQEKTNTLKETKTKN